MKAEWQQAFCRAFWLERGMSQGKTCSQQCGLGGNDGQSSQLSGSSQYRHSFGRAVMGINFPQCGQRCHLTMTNTVTMARRIAKIAISIRKNGGKFRKIFSAAPQRIVRNARIAETIRERFIVISIPPYSSPKPEAMRAASSSTACRSFSPSAESSACAP